MDGDIINDQMTFSLDLDFMADLSKVSRSDLLPLHSAADAALTSR
jgi:hypothetical protein